MVDFWGRVGGNISLTLIGRVRLYIYIYMYTYPSLLSAEGWPYTLFGVWPSYVEIACAMLGRHRLCVRHHSFH